MYIVTLATNKIVAIIKIRCAFFFCGEQDVSCGVHCGRAHSILFASMYIPHPSASMTPEKIMTGISKTCSHSCISRRIPGRAMELLMLPARLISVTRVGRTQQKTCVVSATITLVSKDLCSLSGDKKARRGCMCAYPFASVIYG